MKTFRYTEIVQAPGRNIRRNKANTKQKKKHTTTHHQHIAGEIKITSEGKAKKRTDTNIQKCCKLRTELRLIRRIKVLKSCLMVASK